MESGEKIFLWQADDWPDWRYDLTALASPLAEVSRAQGMLIGRLAEVGFAWREQASLAVLIEEAVKTIEIEGEQLNVESVRSSRARYLGVRSGVRLGALAPVDRNVEGVVEMMLDATGRANGCAGVPFSGLGECHDVRAGADQGRAGPSVVGDLAPV